MLFRGLLKVLREAHQRLRSASSSSLVVRRTSLSNIGNRSFSDRRFSAVEHSAAEQHDGAVNDYF